MAKAKKKPELKGTLARRAWWVRPGVNTKPIKPKKKAEDEEE